MGNHVRPLSEGISERGLNPLSFVTAFTVGELGTVLALYGIALLDGGLHSSAFQLFRMPGVLFLALPRGFILSGS